MYLIEQVNVLQDETVCFILFPRFYLYVIEGAK